MKGQSVKLAFSPPIIRAVTSLDSFSKLWKHLELVGRTDLPKSDAQSRVPQASTSVNLLSSHDICEVTPLSQIRVRFLVPPSQNAVHSLQSLHLENWSRGEITDFIQFALLLTSVKVDMNPFLSRRLPFEICGKFGKHVGDKNACHHTVWFIHEFLLALSPKCEKCHCFLRWGLTDR